jgi:flagellum-specific peptidoglycan hydrolase FlgJ
MMRRIENIVKALLISFTCLVATYNLRAQNLPNAAIVDYIETYAPLAMKEMTRSGVPASITIAQGILETDAGRSDLVLRSNNHFGIKCKSSWTGDKVYHDDDAAGECFRKYGSASDSYMDHSDYLKSQPRYSFLFSYEKDDYNSWAWGLKKAGYATNPIYAQTLIKYVENYKLNELNHFAEGDDETAITAYISALKNNLPILTSVVKNNAKSVKSEDDDNSEENTKTVAKKSPEKYPSGVFKLEGRKVIYAKEGTSLLALAKKNKISFSGILAWNDLPRNTVVLENDQLIYLQHQKKHIKSHKRLSVHVVKKGESLYTIAKKYNVSVDSIKESNNIKHERLQPGQSLKIQK